MGSELAFQQSLNQQFFPELLPEKEKIYFFLQGKELFTEIYQNLQMKIEEVEAVQSGSWQIISIPLQVDDWENLGVGFSRQELQEINTGGSNDSTPHQELGESDTSFFGCHVGCFAGFARCLDDHF